MPHGVLVQVQSRAPIKLFMEKLPLWRFFIGAVFYVNKYAILEIYAEWKYV